MVKSVNSVYAQEGVDAGLARVRATAVKLGIPDSVRGMDPANTSMTLGTATPSALDLAGVYATLADHGRARTPWSVVKLERVNPGGAVDVPKMPEHDPTEALDRETADSVTDVLRDVVSPRGTGAAALDLNRPAAGKTGTTDSNLSAWFAGYTPELATTVGLFRENPKTHAKEPLAGTAGLTRINGGTFPTRIWTAYMAAALDGTPTQDFDLKTGHGTPAATPWPTAPAGSTPSATTPTTAPAAGGEPANAGPAPGTPPGHEPSTPAATGRPAPGPITPSPQAPKPTTEPEQPSPTPRPSQVQPTRPTAPPSATGGPASRPAAPPTP